jgi:phage terminase Nu1 subunit (DNA packaging protein)
MAASDRGRKVDFLCAGDGGRKTEEMKKTIFATTELTRREAQLTRLEVA